MCKYTNKLREYLDHDPIQYAEGDSLLDELYWCYTESNFNANPELREQFQKLYHSMPELSESKFDEIFRQYEVTPNLQNVDLPVILKLPHKKYTGITTYKEEPL